MTSTTLLPTATQARYDAYVDIHKALRAFMGDTLTKVGSLDPQDDAAVAAVQAQAGDLLRLCRTHLEHEDAFIHTAMEARAPGSTGRVMDDHEGHVLALQQLWLDVDALSAQGPDRAGAVAQLYRRLAVFVAENLEHMDREERDNNAVLWAHYTDEEILAIEKALVAHIAPEEMRLALAWMLPALNPQQRAAKLAGIRAGAPAPVFQTVLDLARTSLSRAAWERLQQDLGAAVLPLVPEPAAAI